MNLFRMNQLKTPIFGLLLATPCVVWALPDDTVRLQLEYDLAHDSNYYRLANASQAQALLGSNNLAVTTQALNFGVDVDLKFSRQIVLLRTNVNQTRFDRPQLQSQNGYTFNADWQWVVGNQWNGSLGFLKSRQLQTQTDALTAQASVLDRNDLNFSAIYLLNPSFSLNTGARTSSQTYSPSSRAILNLEENTLDLGFRFISRAGNQIGLQLQQIDGRYVNRAAPLDRYRQSDISLQSDWRLGGHTLIHAQVGKTRREDKLSTQSSPSWRFAVDWTPTGATALGAYASQQITSSDSLTTATSSVSNTQGLNANWQVSAKTVLNAALTAEALDYSGIARSDKTQTATLGLRYQPISAISIGLSYQIGNRDSNVDSANYRYRLVTANIRGSF